MIRPSTNGPLSLMRTTVVLPVSRSVTFTMVPKGRLLCAAVIRLVSKISPLEVVLPWNFPPYQEARPSWPAKAWPAPARRAIVMKKTALIVSSIGISRMGVGM